MNSLHALLPVLVQTMYFQIPGAGLPVLAWRLIQPLLNCSECWMGGWILIDRNWIEILDISIEILLPEHWDWD